MLARTCTAALAFLLCKPVGVLAMGDADPLLHKVSIHELEFTGSADDLAWDMDAWIGHDHNKLVLTSSAERNADVLNSHELQLLYSHAVTAFWDAHIGWRGDTKPSPRRNWLALGVAGTAPWMLNTELNLYLDTHGRSNLTLEAEREFPITQQLHLVPDIEVIVNGKDDADTGNGSGLAEISTGLRLKYSLTRQFSPYLGVAWSRSYATTADYSRAAGEPVNSTRFLLGISTWF